MWTDNWNKLCIWYDILSQSIERAIIGLQMNLLILCINITFLLIMLISIWLTRQFLAGSLT